MPTMRPIDKICLAKTVRYFSSFEEMEAAALDYALSQTPQQRWEEMELIRQLVHPNYDPITAQISRPVKIVQRAGLKAPARRRRGRRSSITTNH